jgi:hypothetical protein
VVDQNLGHLVALVVRPVDDHEPCIIVADDDGLSAYDDSFDVLVRAAKVGVGDFYRECQAAEVFLARNSGEGHLARRR